MRIAPSTPNPGLIFVSRVIGVGVALAVELPVAVAFALVVEEGVSVSVVGNTEVIVDERPADVDTKVEVKLLVVTEKDVDDEELAEEEVDVLDPPLGVLD